MQIDMDKVVYITETSLTIRGSRRRTTVPKEIVERLALTGDDKIRWVLLEDTSIYLTKVKR